MWDWRRIGKTPREVPPSPAPIIQQEQTIAPAPQTPTEHEQRLFFGCADIHTPHFGVTATPLDTADAGSSENA